MEKSCIIDNWSLQLVCDLLQNFNEYSENLSNENHNLQTKEKDKNFLTRFGALSNLLNGIVFYDDLKYLNNGKSESWKSYGELQPILKSDLTGVNPPDNYLQLYNEREKNFGVNFYFLMSKSMNSALFLSPQRSDKLMRLNSSELTLDSLTSNLLAEIDDEINVAIGEKNDNLLSLGIESNQVLPTLTQFIFSEANSITQVFEIAKQLKDSPEVKSYKSKIREILSDNNKTKDYIKIKDDLKKVYTDQFRKTGLISEKDTTDLTLGISLWFLKVSGLNISISTPIINRKKHLVLLRNLTKIRLEMFNSKDAIKRIANS